MLGAIVAAYTVYIGQQAEPTFVSRCSRYSVAALCQKVYDNRNTDPTRFANLETQLGRLEAQERALPPFLHNLLTIARGQQI